MSQNVSNSTVFQRSDATLSDDSQKIGLSLLLSGNTIEITQRHDVGGARGRTRGPEMRGTGRDVRVRDVEVNF